LALFGVVKRNAGSDLMLVENFHQPAMGLRMTHRTKIEGWAS
jgi:hypothetical protein